MALKYYAVKVGRNTGIYRTWDECRRNVNGFSGAVYKSFPTYEEAAEYMGISAVERVSHDEGLSDKGMSYCSDGISEQVSASKRAYAFVDGSFNQSTSTYGYGGFLVHDGKREVITGSGKDEEMASMRNVAGEVGGSMAAIRKALELGLTELDIYYDYMGIQMWATGDWKRNKKGTIEYYNFIQSVKNDIKLNFIKVKGHSGIEGNEEADRLAKQAVSIG